MNYINFPLNSFKERKIKLYEKSNTSKIFEGATQVRCIYMPYTVNILIEELRLFLDL